MAVLAVEDLELEVSVKPQFRGVSFPAQRGAAAGAGRSRAGGASCYGPAFRPDQDRGRRASSRQDHSRAPRRQRPSVSSKRIRNSISPSNEASSATSNESMRRREDELM